MKSKDDAEPQSGVLWMPDLWFPVSIGFCPSEKEWDALMKHCKIDDWGYPQKRHGSGSAWCSTAEQCDDYTAFCVITIAETAEQKFDGLTVLGLLVHECQHALDWLLDQIGEEKPSREFHAYSLQSIFQFIVSGYNRTRWEPYHGKSITAPEAVGATDREIRPRARRGIPRER